MRAAASSVATRGCPTDPCQLHFLPFHNPRFQIHSANSLAEWPALLRKGARSFKVDPRWLHGEVEEEEEEDAGGWEGAFILSHDPPLPPWDWEGRGYNYTLADLLDAIMDPAGPAAAVARSDPPLRIALCFKGAPIGGPCGGAPQAQRWLRAVDGFFEAARERLAASGLAEPGQVEFVLDGNALPMGCLAQRWRPWASVWMNGSGPDAAFTSDVPASEGLDRFLVLNEAARVERWAYYADPQVHYGKFSRPASPYPYQAWEPAAQTTIQELVRVFAEGPPHAPGLDFATNADVAMLQVYAGVGLNQELPTSGGGAGQVEGLVAILRPGLALVLEQQEQQQEHGPQGEQQALLRAYAFDARAPLSSLRARDLVLLPLAQGVRLSGYARSMVPLSPHSLWISSESGRFFVYDVHEEVEEDVRRNGVGGSTGGPSLRLELRQAGSLVDMAATSAPMTAEARLRLRRRLRRDEEKGGRRRWSLSTTVLRQEGSAVTVLELFAPGQEEGGACGLAVQIATVPLRGGGVGDDSCTHLRAPVCLWPHNQGESLSVEAAAAVVLETDGGGVVVFAAAGGEVLALLLDDGALGNAGGPRARDGSCWVQVGVGDHVSAAALPAHASGRNDSVVMLVAGGGFCYNSHLHNTGPVDVCRLHPERTPGVLDYTYGRAREWAALLREACQEQEAGGPQPAAPVKRLVSVCDAALLHGSYDLGTRPSLALYPLPGGHVGMLEVHGGFAASCPAEDVPPLGANASSVRAVGGRDARAYHWLRACDCGPALPRPGRLVADSFPMRGL